MDKRGHRGSYGSARHALVAQRLHFRQLGRIAESAFARKCVQLSVAGDPLDPVNMMGRFIMGRRATRNTGSV